MAENYFSDLENVYSMLDIEDEIDIDVDSEFDLLEIDSSNTYDCSFCGATLKTKKGIERHEGRHRLDSSIKVLDLDCWHVLSKSSIGKLIEEVLLSDSVLEKLSSYNDECVTDCLTPFTVCIPLVNTLQKFYPLFYKVVTQTSSLHGLSKEATCVVGFELANHIIAHYKKLSDPEHSPAADVPIIVELCDRDVAIITYISGYVFSEYFRRLRKSPNW